MQTVNVELGDRSYPIYIGQNLLQSPALVADRTAGKRIMLVSDTNVTPTHADRFDAILQASGLDTCRHTLDAGENNKTLDAWQGLIDDMVANGLGRDSMLCSVGGGVVGDITGFAAASFMRGIPFLQVPTTLLSQLDASVGGKTGVNHPYGKNLIGAFHQPLAVIIDTNTLGTLDDRNYRSGFAEAVKIALVADPEFFAWLEDGIDRFLSRDPAFLAEMIERCCTLKAEIVADDEREHGHRAILNLGHTFGHAIEKLGAYQDWLHGEAVSMGLVIALKLSATLHQLDGLLVDRSIRLLSRAGLPVTLPDGYEPEALVKACVGDKKSLAGGVRLVSLTHLGEPMVENPMDPGALLGLMHESGI